MSRQREVPGVRPIRAPWRRLIKGDLTLTVKRNVKPRSSLGRAMFDKDAGRHVACSATGARELSRPSPRVLRAVTILPNEVRFGYPCRIAHAFFMNAALNRTMMIGDQEPRLMKVVLAQPRGFCAGVVRAIEIVERALLKHGAPVYVRHEIVHNRHVVEGLMQKGAIFVKDVSEVPPGAVIVFSAHGVARSVEQDAVDRGLNVLDATCPLVAKVHAQGVALRGPGPDRDPDRACGSPGSRGKRSARSRHPSIWWAALTTSLPSICRPTRRSPISRRRHSASNDTRGMITALKARFSDIIGPETRDIRYATQKPAGVGSRTRADRRRDPRRRGK